MNIFIVEDSLAIRRLLVRRLDALPGMRVVGEAVGECQALALIRWTQPDVVLVDLSLADGSGLGLVAGLRQAGFRGRIAVLTAQDLDAYRRACTEAGADAFYDKASGLETLFDDLASLDVHGQAGLSSKPDLQLRDGLTGLCDEVALFQRLDQASRTALRDGVSLAVCVLRIDGLARLPARAGDDLARQVAQRLNEASSEADIVARCAPDQFTVVLTRLEAPEQAAQHAARLTMLMAQPFVLAGRERVVSVEIGVALFPADAVSPGGLLTLAQASAFGAM